MEDRCGEVAPPQITFAVHRLVSLKTLTNISRGAVRIFILTASLLNGRFPGRLHLNSGNLRAEPEVRVNRFEGHSARETFVLR